MPSPRFDRARIQDLLQVVAERLDGEWLLIGGAAAAAWFAAARTTEDLDMIGLGGTQRERLALMELASEVGLPVEAVNSAADYFIRRVSDWRSLLVPLVSGHATIYRPNATLFLLLKVERLTALDLDDCLALLAHCAITGERVDAPRVRARLEALPATEDEALRLRRTTLLAQLGGWRYPAAP